jgi:hypothetical protein
LDFIVIGGAAGKLLKTREWLKPWRIINSGVKVARFSPVFDKAITFSSVVQLIFADKWKVPRKLRKQQGRFYQE